jgi:hypothetical protein
MQARVMEVPIRRGRMWVRGMDGSWGGIFGLGAGLVEVEGDVAGASNFRGRFKFRVIVRRLCRA